MSDTTCYVCKSTEEELRPYGLNGQWICFDCMMGDPERQAESARQFENQMNCGPIVVIGEETGPRPLSGVES